MRIVQKSLVVGTTLGFIASLACLAAFALTRGESNEAVLYLAALIGAPASLLVSFIIDGTAKLAEYVFVAIAPLANGIFLGFIIGVLLQGWHSLRERVRSAA